MKFIVIFAVLLITGAGANLLEDSSGDVQIVTPAASIPAHQAWLDIQSMTFEENNTHAQLTINFAEAAPGELSRTSAIQFLYGDSGHRFESSDASTDIRWFKGSDDQWEFQKRIGQITATPTSVTFHLPRVDITDASGVSLELGRTLNEFVVEVQPANTQFEVVNGNPISDFATLYDRMPDQGAAGTYQFQLPTDPSAEFVWISSDDVRYSNGVAKTYEYKLGLLNQGEQAQTFTASFENLPEGWIAQSLLPVIEVAAGESVQVSTLLAVPFRHVHGETQSFDLVLTGTQGTTLRKALQVSYLEIAQPAGHHPQVWVYESSRDSALVPVFNDFIKTKMATTMREQTGNWVRGNIILEEQSNLFWCIPLSESLKVGLQPNATKEGLLSTSLSSVLSYDGDIQATIFIADPRDSGAPANGPCEYARRHVTPVFQTEVVQVSFNGETTLEVPLKSVSGDSIPPAKGQELFLHVEMAPLPGGRETDLQPLMSVDTTALLPLDEYHEVESSSNQVSNAVLKRAQGAVARIETGIPQNAAYSWVATADWFTEIGSEFVEFVAVVPDDALAGTIGELAIQYGDQETLTERYFVVVDPSSNQSDELPAEAKETPYPFLLIILVLFALRKR